MSQAPDLSIVIVSFRAKEHLRVALTSVFESRTTLEFEVFVVDNDSGDGSAEMVEQEFPRVVLIRNENSGFSKANNIALRRASGRLVLTLNPDTKLGPDVLEECAQYMDAHPDIGALSCRVVMGDGSLDKACRRSFPDPWAAFYRFSGLTFLFPASKKFGAYNLTFQDEHEAIDVDSVSGCFLLTRKTVLDEVGLFDEHFFMYGEDIDLCYRIKQAGHRIFYYPAVTTVHYKGQSSRKLPAFSLWHFHDAMWIFYKKHYAREHTAFFTWLVRAGITGRYGMLRAVNAIRRY